MLEKHFRIPKPKRKRVGQKTRVSQNISKVPNSKTLGTNLESVGRMRTRFESYKRPIFCSKVTNEHSLHTCVKRSNTKTSCVTTGYQILQIDSLISGVLRSVAQPLRQKRPISHPGVWKSSYGIRRSCINRSKSSHQLS